MNNENSEQRAKNNEPRVMKNDRSATCKSGPQSQALTVILKLFQDLYVTTKALMLKDSDHTDQFKQATKNRQLQCDSKAAFINKQGVAHAIRALSFSNRSRIQSDNVTPLLFKFSEFSKIFIYNDNAIHLNKYTLKPESIMT